MYNGNPGDGRGRLVFMLPALELLEVLSKAKFEAINIAVSFDPAASILANGCLYPNGHTWPRLCVAAKSVHAAPTFATML